MRRRSKRDKAFCQIPYFRAWLEENKDKFIYKPKYFYKKTRFKRQEKEYLFLRYEGIINNIVVQVDNYGMIDVLVENLVGLECVDILFDCLVALKTDKDGKYYNISLLEDHRKYYDRPKDVFYDEFNNFLECSNLMAKGEFLYVYNCYESLSYAHILKPEELNESEEKDTKESISRIIPLKKQLKCR